MKAVGVVIILALIVAALGLAVSLRLRASPELAPKPEISLLQEVEFRNRGKSLEPPVVVDKSEGYCSAGIVATNRLARVWILLRSTEPPLVKKSADVDYRVSQHDIDRLSDECDVSSEVLAELRSHLAPPATTTP